MAIYASHVSYDLANFADRPEIKEILDLVGSRLTSAFRQHIESCLRRDGSRAIVNNYQPNLAAGCTGYETTIGDLSDTFSNEVTPQVIIAKSLKGILLGRSGLVRSTKGGFCTKLLQDIQIGFVRDVSKPHLNRGPVIISGRNRLLALQAMVAAVVPHADIRSLRLRVMAYEFASSDELEDAIVAANSGRDFPASEQRDKDAAGRGLQVTSKDSIRTTVTNELPVKAYSAVMGAWLRLHAAETGCNGLTASQVADAGSSLYAMIAKDVHPEGMTLSRWFKEDLDRLIHVCTLLEPVLEREMTAVAQSRAGGRKSTRLAERLLPTAMRAFPA
jgi:hypothetical protein